MRRLSFLFGHRGTGKSRFLESLKSQPELRRRKFFDLDLEIEKAGQSVAQIFAQQGEETFRQMEFQTLERLLNELDGDDHAVMALGAGFRLTEWNETPCAKKWAADSEWIWLRRESDERGRIFLDRPRLNSGLAPLAEFELRFQKRQPIFQKQADFILDLPEGFSSESHQVLSRIFTARPAEVCPLGGVAIYTLNRDSRRHSAVLAERLMSLGLVIELRSDRLTSEDFLFWHQNLPREKQLLSHRGQAFPEGTELHGVFGVDWALEDGRPEIPSTLVSLHEDHNVHRFSEYASSQHLKWAPRIESFDQLKAGFEWQQEDPDRRSFLPRSEGGRWAWFRQLMKGRQKINFVRMGRAGALKDQIKDQPTFFEWLQTQSSAPFAAVLGDPVWQSFTPSEQGGFFAERGLSTFKIHLSEGEWKEAFPILESLGMKAAAVTSPLKKKAARRAGHKSEKVCALESANTLVLDQGYWYSENTDEGGLAEAAVLLRSLEPTMVWGGGGTLAVLHALWPKAFFYSVRTGLPREAASALVGSPQLLIWAAGPRDPEPPGEIHPEVVLDLNYREDSAARELSIRVGARYISGLDMFRAQARLQREFWESKLKPKLGLNPKPKL